MQPQRGASKTIGSLSAGGNPISVADLSLLAVPGLPERGLAQIWAEAQNLDAATVKKLALEIPQHRPKDEAWEQVRQAILERWLEVDPRGVIVAADANLGLEADFLKTRAIAEASKLPVAEARRFLLEIPHASLRRETIVAFVRQLAQQSIADAQKFASGLERGKCRSGALAALAGAWAKQDSAAAMAWINSVEPAILRPKLTNQALVDLTEQDPMAALAIRAKLGEQAHGFQLAKCYATDPKATLAWIESQPLGVREGYFSTLIELSPEMSFDDKLSLVLAMPISTSRKWSLEALGREWGKHNPAKGWSWIATLDESEQSVVLTELCQSMGASRSIEEIEKLLPMFPEKLSQTVAEGVAKGLPFADARKWIDRVFQDPEAKEMAYFKLVQRESERFSPEVADWVFQLEHGSMRLDQYLRNLQRSGAPDESETEMMYKWLDGAPREAVFRGFLPILYRIERLGSEEAQLEYVIKFHQRPGVEPQELDAALEEALRHLAHKPPADAWERVNAFPETLRPAASVVVLRQWTKQDPTAAAAWTMKQDDPALVRAAIESLSASSVPNIDAVAKLSTKLPDAEEAFEFLQPCFQKLQQLHPESAAAALKAHQFTEDQIKALHEPSPLNPFNE
jgi:hypothetical protein